MHEQSPSSFVPGDTNNGGGPAIVKCQEMKDLSFLSRLTPVAIGRQFTHRKRLARLVQAVPSQSAAHLTVRHG